MPLVTKLVTTANADSIETGGTARMTVQVPAKVQCESNAAHKSVLAFGSIDAATLEASDVKVSAVLTKHSNH